MTNSLSLRGFNGENLFFVGKAGSVVLNATTMQTVVFGPTQRREAEQFQAWQKLPAEPDKTAEWTAVAEAALLISKINPISEKNAEKRTYTVPKKVADLAVVALKSYAPEKLGPEAYAAATLLSSGQQLSIREVTWISRYHAAASRRSTDLSHDTAWGGAEGALWASGLSTKFGYDSLVASVDASRFSQGLDTERSFWTSRDKSGHARNLWTLSDSSWQAWVDGAWVASAGPVKNKIELDDDTAVFLAAALFDAPDTPVSLRLANPTEWNLFDLAAPYFDWKILDHVALRAAAAPGTEPSDQDGNYTPAERSENASGQLRDANGMFAKMGDLGLIKTKNIRGTIKTINPFSNQIVVDAEDGHTYQIDPKDFEIDGQPSATYQPTGKPMDFSGILGQPRATDSTPKAWLKSVLQPMGPKQLKDVVSSYEDFITSERNTRAGDFESGTGWSTDSPTAEKDAQEQKKTEAEIKKAENEVKKFNKKYKNHKSEPGAVLAAAQGLEAVPTGPLEALSEDKNAPDTSDVAPIYMAEVDPEDTRAVLELISLVPGSKSTNEVATYKRVGGEWVEDPKILQDLRSATPPPVVKLDGTLYGDVLTQVDNAQPDVPEDVQQEEEAAKQPVPFEPVGKSDAPAVPAKSADSATESPTEPETPSEPGDPRPNSPLVSAGGINRNRGQAEELRRYWTVGRGGAKIRWNTGGDWRRCVRNLSKHLGVGAKGYCALRHHEMTGMWPGDRNNRQGFSYSPDSEMEFSTSSLNSKAAVLLAAGTIASFEAQVEAARAKMAGLKYEPVLNNAEDIDTGRAGASFVIPLVVPEGTISSGDKRHFHKGSLGLRTFPLPLMWQPLTGEGHDSSAIVGRIDHVERIPGGLGNAYGVFDTGPYGREAQRLVEAKMLRWISVDLDKFEVDEAGSEIDKDGKMLIKKGRMMGATLVAKPAFQECVIELLPATVEPAMSDLPNNVSAISASAAIAMKIPVEPPQTWFSQPNLTRPTPIQVSNDGQVYGHIATWTTSHIGMARATNPPRSYSNYAYFNTGVVRTAEGTDVTVGQLTLAGGHADLRADAAAAVRHYDDTASAVADVHAGEDEFGIWVAGALRPGTTPEQIRVLRASTPSGDWRSVNGGPLELVAVCQVNVPGFPVPHSLAASGAAITSLVAAGVADLIDIRAQENAFGNPDDYFAAFKSFPPEQRDKLSKEGKALKDGSFPIENENDLKNAIQALGRAAEGKKAEVRRHIVKRARALKRTDLIPDSWGEASSDENSLEALAASAQERIVAGLGLNSYLAERNESLVASGQALFDGSFPITSSAELRKAIHSHDQANQIFQATIRRHIVKNARALDQASMVPATWREAHLPTEALERRDKYEFALRTARERKVRELADRIKRPELEKAAEAALRRIKGEETK